jgi:ankyrin repeat protein
VPISVRDPHVAAAIRAVQTGEVAELRVLLDGHEGLASARIERRGGTLTLLHFATDWPGYFPRGPEVVGLLVERRADPNAPTDGKGNPETPLHWAASSDDADVAEALIELGAELTVPGGSIGTPLDNAVGYGCWHVARLLVARGAPVEGLWQAAALGLAARVEELLERNPPSAVDLNHAFWQACHGGQRRTAEFLLARGADVNATPWHSDRTPLDIAGSIDTRRETMAEWLRAEGALPGSTENGGETPDG